MSVRALAAETPARLRVKRIVMGECSHAFRSVYDVGNRWLGWSMPPIPIVHAVDFFHELFDAIINAGLLRQFDKPAYRGFFESINPPDKFPHMLLRPPVGWPDAPVYPNNIGPAGTVRILRQLFPPRGAFRPVMPFYDEILDLIKEDMREKGMLVEVPVLLGDHETQDAYKSKFLKDAMGRVAKKWPMSIRQFGPPGQGGYLSDWQLDPYSTTQEVRRAFANVLRIALGRGSRCFGRSGRPSCVAGSR